MAGDSGRFWLGLDLGVASIGWALIRIGGDGEPCGIEATGVRRFEAGVNGTALDVRAGKDTSRAAARRKSRQIRRMIARKVRRNRRILRILQRAGLMPAGPTRTPEERSQFIERLDGMLREEWPAGSPSDEHLLPYRLRAAAVEGPVSAYAVGRAIYNIAQHRGPNFERRDAADGVEESEVGTKAEKDEGKVVQPAITKLQQDMRAAGCVHVGQFLAKAKPEEKRLRGGLYASRAMYRAEFDAIIAKQGTTHPGLTPSLIAELRKVVFFQRPLRSARHQIGECALEPGRQRAPLAFLEAQRFRMLSIVNNLRVIDPTGCERALSDDERCKLVGRLESDANMTFDAIRALFGWPKTKPATKKRPIVPGFTLNLELGGEERICGNTTVARIRQRATTAYDQMSAAAREQLVQTIWEFENVKALTHKLMKAPWNLDVDTATHVAGVKLEDGYAAYSRQALRRLLPYMEQGLDVENARRQAYGIPDRKVQDLLPPALDAVPGLRNPALRRVLTETRKVVNAIIRRWGKPERIVVELVRELRQPKKRREKIAKSQGEQRSRREIVRRFLETSGVAATDANIEKWMLAQECQFTCPYTGRTGLTIANLFFDDSDVDVEHIIPRSVSLDNSFGNKTLCDRRFNQQRKGGQIPTKVFTNSAEEWDAVVGRVKRFTGPAAAQKLRRFLMTEAEVVEEYQDMTARHLTDTAGAARAARGYLSCLYPSDGKTDVPRQVVATPGRVTAWLRSEWDLNRVLSKRDEKERDDHRHHAIDAVVIALTTASAIKRLSDAARRDELEHRRHQGMVTEPWIGFTDDVRDAVAKVIVSYRPDHKVSGAYHDQSNYSRPITEQRAGGYRETVHRVRKLLDDMSLREVNSIADCRVREAVMKVLSDGDPGEVFKGIKDWPTDAPSLPYLLGRDGKKRSPIRCARVNVRNTPKPVGGGPRRRYVDLGEVHHLEVIAVGPGRDTGWEVRPAKRMDVIRRLKSGRGVVVCPQASSEALVLVLHKGDIVEMDDQQGQRRLYVIRSISAEDIVIRELHEGRTDEQMKAERGKFRVRSAEVLRKRGAKIVTISPIGEVLSHP